jgi:hypothetical protein
MTLEAVATKSKDGLQGINFYIAEVKSSGDLEIIIKELRAFMNFFENDSEACLVKTNLQL